MPVTYKDVPGFLGYRVGDDGSFWSNFIRRSKGYRKGTYVVPFAGVWEVVEGSVSKSTGYRMVTLPDRVPRTVHSLVLLAFVGPRPDGMESCHNDGSKTNNALSNLRYDTNKANQADRIKHGTSRLGELHGCAKVTDAIVRSIRNDYATGGFSQKFLADKYGLTQPNIGYIVRRETWKHIE